MARYAHAHRERGIAGSDLTQALFRREPSLIKLSSQSRTAVGFAQVWGLGWFDSPEVQD